MSHLAGMSNVLDEATKQEILALGRLGFSLRQIERATGVRRETASAYLKAAGVGVRRRGGRQRSWSPKPATTPEVSTDSEPSGAVVPDVVMAPRDPVSAERAPGASACEPFREEIADALARGRNAMAIWQDLVDQQGFRSGYASVKRFALKLRGETSPAARVVIRTAPGEEAQVDYGDGPMVLYPGTGKYRRTRLFVMTLGYSRKSVRLLTWQSSTQTWAELHERAFRRLGGTVRWVVLDNLREGVIKPDIYDPTLNPLYREMLEHYDVVAMPCRVRDPDRKGKVESAVGHAQSTPLKGLRFDSIEAAQAHLDGWETRWADTRIHGTTKRQVAMMFAEEKPHLQALPLAPFRYYCFGDRTVNLDGCVEVEAAYYGAPPGWIGQRLPVQWDELHVRLMDPKTKKLLREHLRTPRGWHRIQDRDQPSRTPHSTQALLVRANSAGAQIGSVCAHIYATEGVPGVRRILGVLSLAKKYGPTAVDEAAKEALELGMPSYRFLRRYLERRPSLHLTLRQVDPLIRELCTYRDLIDRQAGVTE